MTKTNGSNHAIAAPQEGGGGMSRAAKKRAKKKRKQSKETAVASKKQRPIATDDDHDETPSKRAEPSENPPTAASEESKVDEMVQGVLSKLTPLQILQLVDLEPDEEQAMVESEQVNVSDLLKETTTRQRARALFQSILGPTVSLKEFYKDYWEQKPLYVSAGDNDETRLDSFLSKKGIQELLETQPTYYGRDLNVTRYEEGSDGVKRRITLDPQPDDNDDYVLVDAKDVWENYRSGCSLRLLCPHKHNDALHALLSTMEWEWGCMVGANVYLTPPGASQGFAPHYDDIEAFVVQLEGYKHWRVYAPLNKAETLPRESSSDYTEADLKGIEPVLDVILGPGDVLYMPRGWIHQACTTARKGHSLHLTISAMQQWSWTDYLELLIPEALEAASASGTSTSLREGLPLRFLDYMGAVHDDSTEGDLPAGLQGGLDSTGSEDMDADDEESKEKLLRAQEIKRLREEFREEAKKRIMRVTKEALSMLDGACDQIGKRFLSDRLPPAFTTAEAETTSESRSGAKIWPNTLVRLARPGITRLALEDDKAVLYHCVDNSRVYHGNPLSPMEFELDDAPALELLLTTTEPHWIQVQDLIHDDLEDKMEIAQSLYDEGILSIMQTETPDRSVQVG